MPSLWTGWVTQAGRMVDLPPFELVFAADGSLSGSGGDEFGRYALTGLWNRADDGAATVFALTKSYSTHNVEYRGESRGSTTLSGQWHIWREQGCENDRGAFRFTSEEARAR